VTVGIYAGIRYMSLKNKTSKTVNIGGSITNAVAMMILMASFKKIAHLVTNWENHRILGGVGR